MFCPTCGEKSEKLIEYNGNKICPKCGCIIEPIEKKNSSSEAVEKKKFNKLIPAKIFAVIGLIPCMEIIYVLLTAGSDFWDMFSILDILFYLFAFSSFVFLLFELRSRKKNIVLLQKCLFIGTAVLLSINIFRIGHITAINILFSLLLLLPIMSLFICNKNSMFIILTVTICVITIFGFLTRYIYLEFSIIIISIILSMCFYRLYRNDMNMGSELNAGTQNMVE